MSETRQAERRTSARHPIIVSMRYANYQGEEDERTLHTAQTVNVSRTGVQLHLEQPIPIPSYINVALRLPDRSAPVLILGKSVWCRDESDGGHSAGVQFMGHIDPAFFDFLDGLKT